MQELTFEQVEEVSGAGQNSGQTVNDPRQEIERIIKDLERKP